MIIPSTISIEVKDNFPMVLSYVEDKLLKESSMNAKRNSESWCKGCWQLERKKKEWERESERGTVKQLNMFSHCM